MQRMCPRSKLLQVQKEARSIGLLVHTVQTRKVSWDLPWNANSDESRLTACVSYAARSPETESMHTFALHVARRNPQAAMCAEIKTKGTVPGLQKCSLLTTTKPRLVNANHPDFQLSVPSQFGWSSNSSGKCGIFIHDKEKQQPAVARVYVQPFKSARVLLEYGEELDAGALCLAGLLEKSETGSDRSFSVFCLMSRLALNRGCGRDVGCAWRDAAFDFPRRPPCKKKATDCGFYLVLQLGKPVTCPLLKASKTLPHRSNSALDEAVSDAELAQVPE